ncbi:PLD nuclease N-terminal domain-containing protein [Paenibacillus sp. NPDC057886]|uniref:PLD nuclease N-terminal domain-containing protein n=1 Tax=Paenibacillus sp. NPDC057886 TaxID=3346270 RepID=UPI0036CA2193
MHYGYHVGIENIREWLPVLLPLLIIQLILISVALWDLFKGTQSKENKWIWSMIIIFVSLFGPVLYFVIGKRDR